MATMKKAQTGKALPPKPKKKTGMDAVKDLGKYVSTFGLATEGYNPAPSKGPKKTMPKKKMKNGGAMLRQAPKSTMEKISSTKLKDVPEKAVNFGKKVINKGKKLASDTVEKVKNTTVGDAAETLLDATTSGAVTAGKALQTGFNKLVGRKRTGGVVKKKMRNGGSLSGLKASNKRVGPIDPKGAFTKVQKKTLAGAKGKASLTKDKQLGATKMAKRGMSIKKK